MTLHRTYGLTRILNARGTYTPLGVSRASAAIGRAVSEALSGFFVIDELQSRLSDVVSHMTGAQAATVTHCVASGITLSIAASMAGADPDKVAALPDASGLPNRVVVPAGHAVDYGHPILTDIRLAGGIPVLAGTPARCTLDDLAHALADARTACLLLVSSRLVRGERIDLAEAAAAAHRRGVPAIIDGAAQDMRIQELLATGADLVLVSPHKYMASPTAGLVIGRRPLVDAVRAQERGIGRAMKATKEAIVGVLAALEERQTLDLDAWRAEQDRKLRWFLDHTKSIAGIDTRALPDPAGMPFSRAGLQVDPSHPLKTAPALASALQQGEPSIWVMDHLAAQGQLVLELVPLDQDELQEIVERLTALST